MIRRREICGLQGSEKPGTASSPSPVFLPRASGACVRASGACWILCHGFQIEFRGFADIFQRFFDGIALRLAAL